jgi:hypothetical protein
MRRLHNECLRKAYLPQLNLILIFVKESSIVLFSGYVFVGKVGYAIPQSMQCEVKKSSVFRILGARYCYTKDFFLSRTLKSFC